MIELSRVAVSFGRVRVLTDITVMVALGDYVTVTGRSGSGKSTLLNVIAGTVTPTDGSVSVAGLDLARARDRVRVQRDSIGYLFQSAHLISWMDALGNVEVGMRYQKVNRRERRQRARDALADVGLAHRLDHRPAALSVGERQRVALARAIARRPSLLLADELTGNLDPDTGAQVIELLERVVPASALVLVTHDPALAARGVRRWQVTGGTVVEELHGVSSGRHAD